MKLVRQSIESEFEALNQSVVKSLYTDVDLVDDIGQYIIDAGGKRIRPILVLLGCKALDAFSDDSVTLATVIEYIHTATLLHDDVVDLSTMRRGRKTANAEWGNAPAVLVGDFIYSRAFELLVNIGQMPIMDLMAQTTNRIAAGEVLQLAKAGSADLDKATYFDIIGRKTAILFEAACRGAAILGKCDEAQQKQLGEYGYHLGIAFQLVDDYLDYAGNAELMGKNLGDDLAEGKTTLPLIIAMKEASQDQASIIASAITNKDVSQIEAVCKVVNNTTALTQTIQQAEEHAARAKQRLDFLPKSTYKDQLLRLADLAIKRDN